MRRRPAGPLAGEVALPFDLEDASGGTDSTSFNNAGLPGVGFQQDPIEYNTLTHHSSLDTYERIIPDDVEKAAAVAAACVWQVANRDEMLPRFTKEQMPPYVKPQ